MDREIKAGTKLWKARLDSYDYTIDTESVTVKKVTPAYYKFTKRAGLVWGCGTQIYRMNYINEPIKYYFSEIEAVKALREMYLLAKKRAGEQFNAIQKWLKENDNE